MIASVDGSLVQSWGCCDVVVSVILAYGFRVDIVIHVRHDALPAQPQAGRRLHCG